MTAFFPVGFRATDSDDNPLAGGYLLYFAAQTTTPKAVYSDAAATQTLGTRVDLNSSGMPVNGANNPTMIYPGTGAYKARLHAADDTLIVEQDNLPGKEEDPAASTSGLPTTPVESKTANFTVVEGDRGKLFKCDSTGGAFEVALPAAAGVGDDFRVGFIYTGTANTVLLDADGSDLIRAQANYPSMALVGQGECVWLVSDGADWIVDTYSPPWAKASNPYFSIKGRAASPPLSATPGDRWIPQGTLTGAWSSFAANDVVEADGAGGWVRYSPQTGWMAYDIGTDELLQFKTGAWLTVPTVVDPGQTYLKTMVVQQQQSSGVNGGAPTTDAWTISVLNTTVVNTIDGATLGSNKITLPNGRYRVRAQKSFYFTDQSQIRFRESVSGTVVARGEVVMAGNSIDVNEGAASGAIATLLGEFEVTGGPLDFQLDYHVRERVTSGSGSPSLLGRPSNIAGTAEVYATVVIEDLRAIQGATGATGSPGSVAFTESGELTIEAGEITVVGTKHSVDTEGDASSDDLDTINGGSGGMMLVLRAADSSRTVVVKDGAGNLALAGDCTLDNVQDTLTLIYDEELTEWLEIARSGNGA